VSIGRKWVREPQKVLLRKALFQVHLWTGLAIGLYVCLICVTGSVLVYRNELYRAFSPQPRIVSGTGTPLDVEALKGAAGRVYEGYQVADVRLGQTPNHAAEITLRRGTETTRRLFHPFTGEDLGNPLPVGWRVTAWVLDLHDNLLSGSTGRRVNGAGAVLILVLCATGAVIWWPGIRTWRRSLIVDFRANWKRLNWTLHSALGFWTFAFIVMWGVTGAYLGFPDAFGAVADYIEPFDETNPADRLVDIIQYGLAYLHFGRLGGRGIPGCGRGLCDTITKAVWAFVALIPPVMFVTGVVMWWNRVVRPAVPRFDRSGAGARSVNAAGPLVP
jgi:uncharacterized iron-regulated membrane protein